MNAPDAAVRMLKVKIQPTSPKIRRLLEELDSDQFSARQKATEALKQAGVEAEPAVRRALTQNPSLEFHLRLSKLLEHMKTLEASSELQLRRAIEILERIGDDGARGVLSDLASRAGWEAVPEAAASLRRLKDHKSRSAQHAP